MPVDQSDTLDCWVSQLSMPQNGLGEPVGDQRSVEASSVEDGEADEVEEQVPPAVLQREMKGKRHPVSLSFLSHHLLSQQQQPPIIYLSVQGTPPLHQLPVPSRHGFQLSIPSFDSANNAATQQAQPLIGCGSPISDIPEHQLH
ncbi:hypothetical protein EOD39_21451 [Acipenser ruthenus]|uniref:Uncharacterized protein n=1 Tax=Acipenser ruthenus TaxID=7906 RepID=A0A444USM6_ACIRT|nr:hypothetical protein EOD39_21451 [Acipenser ruthenus]